MKRIEEIVNVEELFDVIPEGTTVPVRCRLSNDMEAVVKYMHNTFGQRVLVNEFIGSCIAEIVGVTVPSYGICNLTKDVIASTNENEEIDEKNSGLAFFTQAYNKTVPLQRNLLPLVRNRETEEIIILDHILNNQDRHAGNMLCDISKGATLYTIDHSHIITSDVYASLEKMEEELNIDYILSNRVLKANEPLYDLLCSCVSYDDQKLRVVAQKVKSTITNNILDDIKKCCQKCGLFLLEMIK